MSVCALNRKKWQFRKLKMRALVISEKNREKLCKKNAEKC